jgi:hypothetical protein
MDQIQTGDVVLMSSITPFAIVVKWCLASEYNHISVAVRIDESFLPDIKVVPTGGKLLLLEFNGDNYKNILTNQIHHGNRLVQLEDLLPKYKKIAVRKLNPIYLSDQFYTDTERFIMENCLSICKMDICSPIFCIFGIGKEENRETPQFCSELVAKYYRTLIPGSLDHQMKWLPSHFGQNNDQLSSLFIGSEIVVKEVANSYMDLFWNGWVFAIIVILTILIIYGIIKLCKK